MPKFKIQALLVPQFYSDTSTEDLDRTSIKRFLHLADPQSELHLVKQDIQARFKKLYPNEDELIIEKLQDKALCDLDPDYLLEDVLESDEILRVIVHNNFHRRAMSETPFGGDSVDLAQSTPLLPAAPALINDSTLSNSRKRTQAYFEKKNPHIPIKSAKLSNVPTSPDAQSTKLDIKKSRKHSSPAFDADDSNISLPPPDTESNRSIPVKQYVNSNSNESTIKGNGRRITSGMLTMPIHSQLEKDDILQSPAKQGGVEYTLSNSSDETVSDDNFEEENDTVLKADDILDGNTVLYDTSSPSKSVSLPNSKFDSQAISSLPPKNQKDVLSKEEILDIFKHGIRPAQEKLKNLKDQPKDRVMKSLEIDMVEGNTSLTRSVPRAAAKRASTKFSQVKPANGKPKELEKSINIDETNNEIKSMPYKSSQATKTILLNESAGRNDPTQQKLAEQKLPEKTLPKLPEQKFPEQKLPEQKSSEIILPGQKQATDRTITNGDSSSSSFTEAAAQSKLRLANLLNRFQTFDNELSKVDLKSQSVPIINGSEKNNSIDKEEILDHTIQLANSKVKKSSHQDKIQASPDLKKGVDEKHWDETTPSIITKGAPKSNSSSISSSSIEPSQTPVLKSQVIPTLNSSSAESLPPISIPPSDNLNANGVPSVEPIPAKANGSAAKKVVKPKKTATPLKKEVTKKKEPKKESAAKKGATPSKSLVTPVEKNTTPAKKSAKKATTPSVKKIATTDPKPAHDTTLLDTNKLVSQSADVKGQSLVSDHAVTPSKAVNSGLASYAQTPPIPIDITPHTPTNAPVETSKTSAQKANEGRMPLQLNSKPSPNGSATIANDSSETRPKNSPKEKPDTLSKHVSNDDGSSVPQLLNPKVRATPSKDSKKELSETLKKSTNSSPAVSLVNSNISTNFQNNSPIPSKCNNKVDAPIKETPIVQTSKSAEEAPIKKETPIAQTSKRKFEDSSEEISDDDSSSDSEVEIVDKKKPRLVASIPSKFQNGNWTSPPVLPLSNTRTKLPTSLQTQIKGPESTPKKIPENSQSQPTPSPSINKNKSLPTIKKPILTSLDDLALRGVPEVKDQASKVNSSPSSQPKRNIIVDDSSSGDDDEDDDDDDSDDSSDEVSDESSDEESSKFISLKKVTGSQKPKKNNLFGRLKR